MKGHVSARFKTDIRCLWGRKNSKNASDEIHRELSFTERCLRNLEVVETYLMPRPAYQN
jgi:hypothetical protein